MYGGTEEANPGYDEHCTRQPPPGVEEPPDFDMEDEKQDARMDDPPTWGMGTDDEGQLWYWQDPAEGPGSYETSIWHFKHHSGEEAYGQEPLEFWSDWDGSDAGDHAIPMPFGEELNSAARNSLFVRKVSSEECKHYVAHKYNADEDPYLDMPIDDYRWYLL
jgi:hypothetical protein